MARNYANLTDDEYNEKVLWIADYIIENNSSTRKASKYATENGFKISNVSVHNMIRNKLSKLDTERFKRVMEVLGANTPKSIEDANTKVRIYSATSYLLQDLTVTEIADMLDSTVDIIYDDLTVRLPKLDKALAQDVKKKLQTHKLENLGQYKDVVPESLISNKISGR